VSLVVDLKLEKLEERRHQLKNRTYWSSGRHHPRGDKTMAGKLLLKT